MNPHSLPQIAIVSPNTLACLGLSGIIRSMMPQAEVSIYASLETLKAADEGHFFHYFIDVSVLMEDAAYFMERRRKTIVLLHGKESAHLPQGLHTLNVYQDEQQLVRSFLRLAQTSHGGHPPVAMGESLPRPQLTPREVEVLRLIVAGLINKEIAARLNVGLTTIISHRKNLTEKLGIKNVSGLTIYAVTNGIIRAEDI